MRLAGRYIVFISLFQSDAMVQRDILFHNRSTLKRNVSQNALNYPKLLGFLPSTFIRPLFSEPSKVHFPAFKGLV